jgi:tetratricopeptide (TPR) repeat protein
LPFVLVLLDFWPLQRVLALPASQAYPVPQFPWRRLVIEKLPLLALSAASCVITIVAQRTAIAPNQNLPLLARFLNAVYAYSAYIWKALWPAHLASFYPYEGFRLTGWQFLLSLALLAGISFWTWRERFRPYLVVGWLWFLGTLVPVIGLVQVGEQAMADRYAYVPLLGIFVMIVWGVSDLAANWRLNRRMIAAAVALILAVLSSLTWRQTGFWHSSYDLWAHALRVTKDNSVAEDYVGSTLLLNDYEATGQRASEPAMVHFQNAARINPRDPIAHLNIGADLHEHGRLPEAAEQYQLVLQLTRDPHLLSKSLIDLGAVNTQMGNYSAARQYYLDALKLEPGNQAAFMNIGKLGMEERIEELSVAASHSPTKDAYFQLGQVQQLAGRTAAARESFQSALKLDPGFAKAQAALSLLSK